MICSCGLRRDHFVCASCGMHAAVDNQPCVSCSYFKFTPHSLIEIDLGGECAPVTTSAASEPSQKKPQTPPATQARRARSARA